MVTVWLRPPRKGWSCFPESSTFMGDKGREFSTAPSLALSGRCRSGAMDNSHINQKHLSIFERLTSFFRKGYFKKGRIVNPPKGKSENPNLKFQTLNPKKRIEIVWNLVLRSCDFGMEWGRGSRRRENLSAEAGTNRTRRKLHRTGPGHNSCGSGCNRPRAELPS